VNNYGVWIDEARSLGLEHTLDQAWDDAACYFEEGRKVLGQEGTFDMLMLPCTGLLCSSSSSSRSSRIFPRHTAGSAMGRGPAAFQANTHGSPGWLLGS